MSGGFAAVVVPFLSQTADSPNLVQTLLTGGGFVFLAAITGGLFLWNKNASEGAKAIAEGSRELIEITRKELDVMERKLAAEQSVTKIVRRDLDAARIDLRDAHQELRAARTQIRTHDSARERERQRFRDWVAAQKIANDLHLAWDAELITKLAAHGIDVDPAPPFGACPDEILEPDFFEDGPL